MIEYPNTNQDQWSTVQPEQQQPVPAAKRLPFAGSRPRLLPVIIGAVIAFVLIGGMFELFSHQIPTAATETAVANPSRVAVAITASGFSPSDVLIQPGTEVVWTNTTSANQQIAANPYPTHTTLPDLVSANIPPHGSFAYVFNRTGQWGYQDFLQPSLNGTVRVSQ